LVTQHMTRGRVELRLSIKDAASAATAYEVDITRAEAYLKAYQQLNDGLKLSAEPCSVEHLLKVTGVILPAESQPDLESVWPIVSDAVMETLQNLDRMRIKEGDFIEKDFVQRLGFIEHRLTVVEGSIQSLLVHYQEKLKARVEALTQGLIELDPARIAQEAGILADRSDISEEVVRARSHIAQFKSIMGADEPAGRKLNFLLQEFNREFNTMGAKVGQASAAHIIVEVKSELEKLREQVQNIE